jgi:hypothetical protein
LFFAVRLAAEFELSGPPRSVQSEEFAQGFTHQSSSRRTQDYESQEEVGSDGFEIENAEDIYTSPEWQGEESLS